jgi:hypothetical protein
MYLIMPFYSPLDLRLDSIVVLVVVVDRRGEVVAGLAVAVDRMDLVAFANDNVVVLVVAAAAVA